MYIQKENILRAKLVSPNKEQLLHLIAVGWYIYIVLYIGWKKVSHAPEYIKYRNASPEVSYFYKYI